MIQLIKKYKSFFLIFVLAILSCKNSGSSNRVNASETSQAVTVEDSDVNDLGRKTSNQDSRSEWKYVRAIPITQKGSKSSFDCEEEKYKGLQIRFAGNSVFLFGKHTDDIVRGKVKAKDFFKHDYLFEFYKKTLPGEFGIELPEIIQYGRNKRAYQSDSELNKYFQDVFFIENFMFIESGGCLYTFSNSNSKQAKVADNKENPSKLGKDTTVSLPFDSRAYYKTCVYPGDKERCREKYPRYSLSDTKLLNIITQTFQIEPFEVFKLESSGFDLYLVHFQGEDVDEYDLISLKNDQVIATLLVGVSDESGVKDFVISDHKVDIFLRTDTAGNSKLIETYGIQETGIFKKLTE